MRYVFDRLREPGTMRSLIWVLLGLMGYQQTDAATVEGIAAIAVMALGAISAMMPAPLPPSTDQAPKP